ncbi:MAG TPA: three-Cys-motif partner protein TcmP [Candidatus Tectomicrobia bacterium]|nr:three-Cys-motif partner protein TcmP [Candidatus Tectomicrobia bacterium]
MSVNTSAVTSTAMAVPQAYHGREQTYVKHRILKHYLDSWAQKLASRARRGAIALWYIDCFAGPWNATEGDYRDTSIFIALEALNAAARTWGRQGFGIEVHALLWSRTRRRFRLCATCCRGRKGGWRSTGSTARSGRLSRPFSG